MISIRTSAQMDAFIHGPPRHGKLKDLLLARRSQLFRDVPDGFFLEDLVHVIVVCPGESVEEVEGYANFPLFSDPAFEWVQDHGGWFEGIVILSDDGFGIALFVPDRDGIDPRMLSVMRDQAMQSS